MVHIYTKDDDMMARKKKFNSMVFYYIKYNDGNMKMISQYEYNVLVESEIIINGIVKNKYGITVMGKGSDNVTGREKLVQLLLGKPFSVYDYVQMYQKYGTSWLNKKNIKNILEHAASHYRIQFYNDHIVNKFNDFAGNYVDLINKSDKLEFSKLCDISYSLLEKDFEKIKKNVVDKLKTL